MEPKAYRADGALVPTCSHTFVTTALLGIELMRIWRTLSGAGLLWALSVIMAHADFIISADTHSGGRPRRIARDGSLRVTYDQGDFLAESFGSTHAVAPDLSTVYFSTNTLGYSFDIPAFDSDSGDWLPDATLHSGFIYAANPDDYIIQARQALIRGVDPLGAGDFFVISRSGASAFSSPDLSEIKRYNRTTDSYVETISPPTPQLIYDFAFGPDNRLYMAGANGVYPFADRLRFPSDSKFSAVNPFQPAITNATGSIAFGPDGLLYLRNIDTGNIDRYTLAGAPLGTFIPASAIIDRAISYPAIQVGRGSIQFGPRRRSLSVSTRGRQHRAF